MPGGRRRRAKPPRSAGSRSFRNRLLRGRHRTMALNGTVRDISLQHRRREQGLMLALALPALLVVLLLLVLPVGWLAWQSIYHDGFTLENYRRILSEDIYWRSFLLSFEVSLLVTLLALMLGYPIAYAAHIAPS